MKKEEAIKRYMSTLDISREEAEQLWEDDNSKEMTEEQADLEKKAKRNIKNYTQSEKAHNKGKKKERAVDTEKLAILQQIQTVIGGEIEKELAIHFEQDGVSYTLKLTKHRPAK